MEIVPILIFVIILFAIIAGIVSFFMRGIQIVPEGNVAIVERQGRFQRVLNPGRHFLIPITDRIREEVPLQEFGELIHVDRVVMRNAITIGLDMQIEYRIAHYYPQQVAPDQARRMQAEPVINWGRGRVRQRDIYNAIYGVDNWQTRTQNEARAVMQDCLAMVDLSKDIFNTQTNGLKQVSAIIKKQLNERTLQYGVEVTDINLTNPVIDDNTRDFLVSIRKAEMQNRIRELEALNQAKIQQLEAESQARVQQTLNLTQEELLRWHQTETLKQISQNPSARIYVGGGGGNSDSTVRVEEPNMASDVQNPNPPSS